MFPFVLTIQKSEFEKLILETPRTYKDSKGLCARLINVLQPQEWTEVFSKTIYDEFRMSHCYNFESNYINSEKNS